MMSGTPPAPQAPPVFDPFAPRTDDHAFVRALAARGPLARTPGGAFYAWRARHADIVTSPDTSRQIELETLAMQGIVDGPIHELFVNGMLFSNGAAHRRRRGPVARTFAFKLMEGMREEIRALAESLIEPRVGAGAFDFLDEVAGALPASVIARVLGVPDADVPQFTRWAYSAVRCLPIHRPEDRPQIARDLAALLDYVDALLAARRARPRDDFLSRFADAAGAEGDMSGAEIRAQIAGLIFAGSDTTRLGIATTLSQLLQHPAQWRAFVADPDGLKKQAVEEGLRFDPVIATIPRVALVDLDLDGWALPAGSIVFFSMLSALRDGDVYADPDRFDIFRADHPRWSIAFGAGAHRCLGEWLARAEIEETLAAIARRAPNVRLEGPPPRLCGLDAVRAIDRMEISLDCGMGR